jgi:hypothetical protein
MRTLFSKSGEPHTEDVSFRNKIDSDCGLTRYSHGPCFRSPLFPHIHSEIELSISTVQPSMLIVCRSLIYHALMRMIYIDRQYTTIVFVLLQKIGEKSARPGFLPYRYISWGLFLVKAFASLPSVSRNHRNDILRTREVCFAWARSKWRIARRCAAIPTPLATKKILSKSSSVLAEPYGPSKRICAPFLQRPIRLLNPVRCAIRRVRLLLNPASS